MPKTKFLDQTMDYLVSIFWQHFFYNIQFGSGVSRVIFIKQTKNHMDSFDYRLFGITDINKYFHFIVMVFIEDSLV